MAGELGRVLIEHPDPWVVGEQAAALRDRRFSVRLCDGPAFRGTGCPALTDGRCALVERADVVVHHLGAAEPGAGPVLDALRRCYPGTPVITAAREDPDALVAAVSAATAYLHRPERPRHRAVRHLG